MVNIQNSTDDYYDYNTHGFANYESTAIDPGGWMLLGTSLYCVLCVIAVPPLVVLGKKWERKRLAKGKWDEKESDDEESKTVQESTKTVSKNLKSGGGVGAEAIADGEIETRLVPHQEAKNNRPHIRFAEEEEEDEGGYRNPYLHNTVTNTGRSRAGHKSVVSAALSGISRASGASTRIGIPSRRHGHGKAGFVGGFDMFQRAIESEAYSQSAYHEPYQRHPHPHPSYPSKEPRADVESAIGFGSSIMGRPIEDDLRPEDAADANDPGKEQPFHQKSDEEDVELTICCGQRSLCSLWSINRAYENLLSIAYPDAETKRIISLGLPFTCSAISESIFDTLTVIIISKYKGPDYLTAYVVVQLLIGITDNFIHGVSSCLSTLCSHAIGSQNFFLAGQYIQLASIFYLLCGIPMLGVWRFIIGDVVELMGMSANVRYLSEQYTQIVIYHYLQDGLFSGWGTITDITGHEVFGTYVEFIEGLVDVLLVWLFCVFFTESYNMFWIGVTHLAVGFLFLAIWLGWSFYQGWLDPFLDGFFSSSAFKNKRAVWNVVQTAIPLGFGSVLEYGEWEVLTFIVAIIGPAEIAAWGILGSLWEVFESATEGLSEAGSIRVAYHLGTGNAQQARKSANKSLFLCFNLSFIITSILFICGDSISSWYTDDPTLQRILNSLIPMIGVGNILMVFGMVSWGLVGAQGRYRLATFVSVFSSWVVTIPLALFFSLYCNFDLSGIVSSVIIGYSTSGMIQAYILLRSDWEHIAKTIKEYNEDYSSDSDSISSESSDE